MATETDKTDFSFQAEVKQLLHLLAHSLYQSREIAVRELVSNASDALDKMRHLALVDEKHRDDAPLEIVVDRDEKNRTLAICDNGVGMTREELVENLGTIAHSGSLDFLKTLTKESKPDLSLIGQFGVGFYSAFMVADKVRVETRSYSENSGWQWESDGTGTFSVSPADGLQRGTRVVLDLKEEVKDFAEAPRIQGIIKRYSSFIPHPIKVDGEVVNDQKAVWVEPTSQVTDEDYNRFYQHLTHQEQEEPLWHLHLSVDSPIQFHALLYCPPTNLELLGFGSVEHGQHLCVRRVLVQHDCRELVPEYLRFLRGIVDSEDLPLNVSRETLQDNTVFQKIRSTVVRSVLDLLEGMAKDDTEKYVKFYRQFGRLLKEGAHLDFLHRQRLAKLLMFLSTHTDDPDHPTSLDEYIERSPAEQKQIYYLGGPDLSTIKASPNLEVFRRRELEVLYLIDPIDEFVVSALGKYEDRELVSIDAADLELPPEADEEQKKDKEGDERSEEDTEAEPTGFDRVLDVFRSALEGKVEDVRRSKRLTDSPCCLVSSEGGMSSHMQNLMKMVNEDFSLSKPIMEVNAASPLVATLCGLGPEEDDFIKLCGRQLFDNALLLEGVTPPAQEMAARMQRFMEQAAEKRSADES